MNFSKKLLLPLAFLFVFSFSALSLADSREFNPAFPVIYGNDKAENTLILFLDPIEYKSERFIEHYFVKHKRVLDPINMKVIITGFCNSEMTKNAFVGSAAFAAQSPDLALAFWLDYSNGLVNLRNSPLEWAKGQTKEPFDEKAFTELFNNDDFAKEISAQMEIFNKKHNIRVSPAVIFNDQLLQGAGVDPLLDAMGAKLTDFY